MNRRMLAGAAALALTAATWGALPARAQSELVLQPADIDFVLKAASGGVEEVTLGKIAQQKGESNDVKSFGRQMIMDHEKANQELLNLAQQKGIQPATEPSPNSQVVAQVMQQMSGPAFDMAYVAQQHGAHTATLSLLQHASQHAADAELKDFANRTIPVVETHLAALEQLMSKVQQGRMPANDQRPTSG